MEVNTHVPDQDSKTKERPGIGARVKKTIGELLVSEGFLDAQQVEEALNLQKTDGRKIIQILLDLGHIDVITFAKFLASRRGVPSINLSNYEIQPDICALLPRSFAIEHDLIPIDKMGKLLTVGMALPLETETIEKMNEMTGLKVKAVYCHSDDIHDAIERNYIVEVESLELPSEETVFRRIENVFKLERIADLTRRVESLPTLPETVRKVQEASEDPDVSIQDVAETVAMDPPISARLLQLANSASYGLSTLVDNVDTATKLLGLRETYSIVLSSAVIGLVEKATGFDHRKFWDTSQFCAMAARNIATASSQKQFSGIFATGLLLDIGRFAFAQTIPKRYDTVDPSLLGYELVTAEENEFSVAHPELGFILAQHWQLPEEMSCAIRFHHAPHLAHKHQDTVTIAALAATMTDAYSQGIEADSVSFDREASLLDAVQLDTKKLQTIYSDSCTLNDVTRDAGAGAR